MKNILSPILLLVFALLFVTGCDRDSNVDGMFDDDDDGDVTEQVLEGTLNAVRVSASMTIDGTDADAIWSQAAPTYFTAKVADIDAFKGYGNRQYSGQVKAAFDSEYLYLLFQYNDATYSTAREPWYFDTAAGKWAQESRNPQFNADGLMTRKGFYEDKLSVMWEASPVAGFFEAGCGVACHVGLSPFQSEGGKSALKYTNNFGEVMDMWHFKYVRTGGNWARLMDDQYTDWTSTNGNGGRHSDAGTGHYANNKATVDGMSVPKYVIPNATETYSWINTDQIASGEAQEVVGVMADGSLKLANGGVLDISNPALHRDGALNPPSVYARPGSGDRADIEAIATYGSNKWTVEIKRKLVTGSETDVQFDTMSKTYPFGVAIFDDAGIAHATSSVRYLKFAQ